ncbi:hypothetical protein [Streptacidiphilus sp. EB129]|uniref:hypothetical protein n=1 Tax=Streptacidiphilus sp. EB129 TaxID=3156262 RepID=UPI0035134FCE
MPRHRTLTTALLVLLGGGLLTGCGPRGVTAQDPQPASLQPVPGSSLHRVVLTPEAVARLAIATAPVGSAAGLLRIPETAIVYDPDGHPWVYTVPAPRTYLRLAVVVAATTQDGSVLLSSGPPPGTQVVDVAAPELLGAEYGVGEE